MKLSEALVTDQKGILTKLRFEYIFILGWGTFHKKNHFQEAGRDQYRATDLESWLAVEGFKPATAIFQNPELCLLGHRRSLWPQSSNIPNQNINTSFQLGLPCNKRIDKSLETVSYTFTTTDNLT